MQPVTRLGLKDILAAAAILLIAFAFRESSDAAAPDDAETEIAVDEEKARQ